MKQSFPLLLLAALSLTAFPACKKKKNDPPAPNAYALGNNTLLAFNVNTPATVTAKNVTGLQAGETLLGIDIRPADKKLYGVGSTSRLYVIDPATGAATAVNAAPFAATLNEAAYGIDFNPAVDRLRIVGAAGQNLRVNPNDGTLAATDVVLTPPGAGVTGIAYSNNTAGAASTLLYDIGTSTDMLYRQDPANAGVLIPVGPLGVPVDGFNGFDISGADKAYAILSSGTLNTLYTVNLSTGALSPVGTFPMQVKGLALNL